MLDDCAVTIFSSEGYFTVYMLELILHIESSSLSKVLCVVFENQKLKGRFGNPFGSVLLNQNNKKDKKLGFWVTLIVKRTKMVSVYFWFYPWIKDAEC